MGWNPLKDIGSEDIYNLMAGQNTGGGFDFSSLIPIIPSVIGGLTSTYGNVASNEYAAEAAEKKRQDDLFLAQLGLMKDMAMIPGGSSSSSWQEGATGNLTGAQRLAAARQTSADKIAQYNNIMQGYYGARR